MFFCLVSGRSVKQNLQKQFYPKIIQQNIITLQFEWFRRPTKRCILQIRHLVVLFCLKARALKKEVILWRNGKVGGELRKKIQDFSYGNNRDADESFSMLASIPKIFCMIKEMF